MSVVGYHAFLGSAGRGNEGMFYQHFFANSYLFVDLFFMLSGFIMMEAYGRKLGSTLGSLSISATFSFYRKRLTKILPNYYVWLTASILVVIGTNIVLGEDKQLNCYPDAVFKHLLLIQNLMGTCKYFNTPLWSIAVEVAAYFIFPLLLIFLRNVVLLALFAIGLYLAIFSLHPNIDLLSGLPSIHRCMAGFISGMLAHKLVSAIQLARYLSNWAIIVFAALIATISLGQEIVAIILMLALVIITTENQGVLQRIFQAKPLYMIGRASFTLYLVHAPVLGILILMTHKLEAELGIPIASNHHIFISINLACSTFAGLFCYVLLEHQFERFANEMRRKKRLRMQTT